MSTRLFQHLPFKRKLTLITVIASGLALVLAGIAFTVYEVVLFRRTMLEHLGRTAQMLGDNSSAALSFRDPASATQTLRSLAAEPNIMAAAIYDESGRVFATYSASGQQTLDLAPPPQADGHRFADTHLELFRTIQAGGEPIGTIRLVSGLNEMHARLWRYLLIVLAVLATSSLGVLVLSHQLHQAILRPIAHLSAVANQVATEKNYSVRAVKEADDEVGRLIEAFNEMLSQIQLRDGELKRARELLEARVVERTRQLEEEIVERRRSETALRESNERFEVVARATSDVIWDWDVVTDEIWWNENFQAVLGHRAGGGSKAAESRVPHVHPDDVEAVRSELAAALRGPGQHWTREYRFRRGDGAYATVVDRGFILRDFQGNAVRMIGALQDVTQQREATAELERTHRELVEASRRAGQAEVATSVLHNVGNVLNSVMVSTAVAADRLRTMRVTNIAQVADLLAQNRSELGPFFTADQKGKVLLEYLPQLARLLDADRAAAATEITAVMRHVEHIREIVARQQSFARTGGVLERVPLATIVDDALALNAESLARHAIHIERRYEQLPVFPVDKHRVLEILVNLVRNAKDAVKAAVPRGQGRIEVVIARTPEARGAIRVIDNGVGIAPENLTRIFQHGFTTRRDGHGFGLHSGALAARQLDGSLQVSSEGPGRGATFTLEIPLPKAPSC